MAPTDSAARTTTESSPDSLKDWVARVPRKAVVHRMETAKCLEDRVFWAIILWSWCGPQVSDTVVIKDRRGYIQKDGAGNPVLAKFGDLLALLGLSRAMKGHLSESIKALIAKGSVRYENRILYPVKEPVAPPRSSNIVPSTDNVFIAGRAYDLDELRCLYREQIVPCTVNDLEACTEAIQYLQSLSTEWRKELKALKTRIEAKRVQGFRERPILIALEEKKRRRETATATAPASAPDPQPPAAAAAGLSPLPDPPPEPAPPVAALEEPTLKEVAEVQTALAEFGLADEDTSKRLIVWCRKQDSACSDVTGSEVAQMIIEKSASIKPSTRDPISLLMKIVPPAIRAARQRAAARVVDPLEAVLSDPDYLTVIEAEEISGIAVNRLFELIESARLPALDVGLTRQGGRYRITRNDLEALQKQSG